MVFKTGVKNIQAAAYNGARTVYEYSVKWLTSCKNKSFNQTGFNEAYLDACRGKQSCQTDLALSTYIH